MTQAIEAKSASLALIGTMNAEVPRAILTLIIADLVEFLNVGNTMSVNQIDQTIKLLLGDTLTKNLKPEDYKVCFDQFKKAGKVYNRIDGQIIFEIVYKYAQERMDMIETMSRMEHERNKSKNMLIHPEVAQMYRQAAQQAAERQKPGKTNVKLVNGRYEVEPGTEEVKQDPASIKQKPVTPKSAREIYIQSLFKEFFEMWKKHPAHVSDNSGKCFVKVDGKIMDEVEYVEHRLEQAGGDGIQ